MSSSVVEAQAMLHLETKAFFASERAATASGATLGATSVLLFGGVASMASLADPTALVPAVAVGFIVGAAGGLFAYLAASAQPVPAFSDTSS